MARAKSSVSSAADYAFGQFLGALITVRPLTFLQIQLPLTASPRSWLSRPQSSKLEFVNDCEKTHQAGLLT